jgi:CheY-like chemotaxis protein
VHKWFAQRTLASYNPQLTREELIKRCRILVIDDERPSLIDDLTRDGFAVDHDEKGDEVGRIERNLFDLILLDVMMPGMTGPELQSELKLRGYDIPIVFITANRDDSLRRGVLEQGAVECLHKPFSDTALFNALQSALRTN